MFACFSLMIILNVNAVSIYSFCYVPADVQLTEQHKHTLLYMTFKQEQDQEWEIIRAIT